MNDRPDEAVETDPRFPSGPWIGFWIQKYPPPGRHRMELRLTFRAGVIHGEGRDWVAAFSITGRYDVADGRCHWTKRYVGKHDVFYNGFNEGKGIWGVWEMPPDLRGGFHIWPEGLPDPTQQYLVTAADVEHPAEIEEGVPVMPGAVRETQ